MKKNNSSPGLYIVLISVHGLVRGHNHELGRDADTGGQIKYVVELAQALAQHPQVERVDLLTRQIIDPKVDEDYAHPEEMIADKAHIIRLPCGPRRYMRKEVLWPYLNQFIDNAIVHIRRVGRTPDVIHSHYADAGYAGARLAQLLGVPLIHTGHSLGRIKHQRLRDAGQTEESIERNYNLLRRIEAEEITLGNASLVITSTSQEVEEQYQQYENYQPKRMRVIPPGVDLTRFHPAPRGRFHPAIEQSLLRFLHEPDKPMILALSRADPRKNIQGLIKAYAENSALRQTANLVIIAGNRDDIATLDKGSREVLQEILLLIDRYDLYGQVALPKHHDADDVPDLYRLAAKHHGVFVNPALTEPFGLTLIEAAASGLPIVATHDGGPTDILRHCKNGMLIDPLNTEAIGSAILAAVTNQRRWRQWSTNGLRGAKEHYSWDGHVRKYIREVERIQAQRQGRKQLRVEKSRLPSVDRLLVSDIDNTLLGDAEGLQLLINKLRNLPKRVGFAVATGRRLDSAMKILKEWDVPTPDIFITAVGSEIHYGNGMAEDISYAQHINYRWQPAAMRDVLDGVPGLSLQPRSEQRNFKLSYYVDPQKAPPLREIYRLLRKQDLHAKLIFSHEAFLDFLPVRASKGLAIRYLAMRWNIPTEHLLVAGDSGNDEEMLNGNTLGVVVGNYSPELEHLRGVPRVYFAAAQYAWGILEGIDHYDFFGEITLPAEHV